MLVVVIMNFIDYIFWSEDTQRTSHRCPKMLAPASQGFRLILSRQSRHSILESTSGKLLACTEGWPFFHAPMLIIFIWGTFLSAFGLMLRDGGYKGGNFKEIAHLNILNLNITASLQLPHSCFAPPDLLSQTGPVSQSV